MSAAAPDHPPHAVPPKLPPTRPDPARPDPARPDPDGWRHLHPLSPLLKGGIALVAVLAYLISQQADKLFGEGGGDPTDGHLGIAAGVVSVVLVGLVAASWLSWRFSRFRVGASLIELRTGFLFRQHRQVHFDRIQAVDVGRPLLARFTGLSEVVVQSAGGQGSQLKLSFLTDAEAQQVREHLVELARRADPASAASGPGRVGDPAQDVDKGAGHPDGAPIPPSAWGSTPTSDSAPASGSALPGPGSPPGDLILRVPNLRIIQSVLYGGPGVVVALAVPALLGSLALGVPQMVAWLGPLTLGVGGQVLRRLTQETNFSLLHQGDRLRIRHGLTDLRTTTVPVHRIQALEISQSLPWRLPGWWRLSINVAGVWGSNDETQTVLMPVGTLEEALQVLDLVLPGLPREVVLAALLGEGAAGGFVTTSERAKPFDPLSWRRHGYAVLPSALVTRRGVAYRAAQFVPHARVQSLRMEQGPLQRARGVASVRLVSTVGPVSPAVDHLDQADAEHLVNEQVGRSALARRLS